MSKITKTINKQTEINIIGVSDQALRDEPIVAVNWFNLKNKLMYTVYNLLALPMARSVGAHPVFKGYQLCSLAGSDELSREVLLLVRYPGPKQFLHLLSRAFFQLISILRIKSVRDFNFGFQQCLELEKSPENEDHEYLVCYFQAPQLTIELAQIRELCDQHNCRFFYFGKKIASLSIKRKGRSTVIPLSMQWLFLVSSKQRESLLDLSRDPEIRKFQDQNALTYLGVFSRVR